ncbi:penicillin-binding protein [Fusobacterium polymorphum]|uniref:penicillin-binding protein n=1 Tax=Fusobacterium nucleatum subsp. polymorphum TaxID=76857 RepID=UPI00300B4349
MIYIYKKEKLIDALNYDINEFKKEWYPDFQDDMQIYDKKFEYPILEKGMLREMTRDERVANNIEITLDEGEFIQDKKLIKVPKPQGNSKYLNWDKEKHLWLLDTGKQYQDYISAIDSIKAKILEYGFDYKVDGKEHRQKCRDKDITLLASNITFMLAEKNVYGKEKPITWYFYDNFGLELNLEKSLVLASYGKTFTQSVYDTENYFKTKVNPFPLTKDEFEKKRKEIHSSLAKG